MNTSEKSEALMARWATSNFGKVFDIDGLSSKVEKLPGLKYVVLDKLWNDHLLQKVAQEFDSLAEWEGEKDFYGAREKKWQTQYEKLPRFGKLFCEFLNQPLMLEMIEKLFSMKGLIPDPYMLGGGFHSTGDGGFLKIHTDFNWHKKLQLKRVINVLIYLNEQWEESYGGAFHLYEKTSINEMKSIIKLLPIFNRTVIFVTDENSFHGQPIPVSCGPNMRRKSIAMYYYQAPKADDTEFTKSEITSYVK